MALTVEIYNALYHGTEQHQIYHQINKFFTFMMSVLQQENQNAEIENDFRVYFRLSGLGNSHKFLSFRNKCMAVRPCLDMSSVARMDQKLGYFKKISIFCVGKYDKIQKAQKYLVKVKFLSHLSQITVFLPSDNTMPGFFIHYIQVLENKTWKRDMSISFLYYTFMYQHI